MLFNAYFYTHSIEPGVYTHFLPSFFYHLIPILDNETMVLTCFIPSLTAPPAGLERPLSVRIVPSESRAERESFGSNRYEPYGKVPYHRWPPGPWVWAGWGAVLGMAAG